MERKELAEVLLKDKVRKDAFKELSSEYAFTFEQLKELVSELDWNEVSRNYQISWTKSMIEYFEKYYINWEIFSASREDNTITDEIIETFKDKWSWSELSLNRDFLTKERIEKYKDLLDWKEVINNYGYGDLFNMEFLQKYIDYIPAEELDNSLLMREIVDKEKDNIIKELRNQ